MCKKSEQVSATSIANSGVAFGTSGARGLVTQFTADVCAAFASAFIGCMKESFSFTKVAIAIDNRPSSYDMAKACASAIKDTGLEVIFYGVVPTPALALAAQNEVIPAIMVTGSHIPFDRNGLKFYRPDGEITKTDEQRILTQEYTYNKLTEMKDLTVSQEANELYINRYTSLFSPTLLLGKRIGIYEHSSAGRELYSQIFEQLGAEVIALERSDTFVPIDTEAVSEEDKRKAIDWAQKHNLDAVFSTDGDGDRPLISDENGSWLRGDILGLLCADALGIEALAVPINCNTAIDICKKFSKVVKTKIGSPYVIAEFKNLSSKYSSIAGFEANGGFLLGSHIEIAGRRLNALPTRDAVLPAVILLASAGNGAISELVDALPNRYSHSDRVKNFATEASKKILVQGESNPDELMSKLGFKLKINNIDNTDGLRVTFTNSTIIHLRPSGNAPELRCYAETDTEAKSIHYVETALKNIIKLNQ